MLRHDSKMLLLLATLFIPSLISSPAPNENYDVAKICVDHDPTKSVLFVSRMDGIITALELSEFLPILWEHDLGYSLISTSTTLSFKDNSVLVPSTDGNLYTLKTGEGGPVIEPYGNLDNLLNKRPQTDERSRWVGGKVLTTIGIEPYGGKVLYKCDMADCKKFNASTVGNDPVLAITSERKTVRLLDLKMGIESWNWSIASVDMQYLGVKERSSCLPPVLDLKFNFDVQKGDVFVQFPDGSVYSSHLGGVISRAWVLNDELLQPVNVFYTADDEPTHDVQIFLGKFNNVMYIQPFLQHLNMPGVGRINELIFHIDNPIAAKHGRSTISWQHKQGTTALATTGSRHLQQADMIGQIWTPRYSYIPKLAVQQVIENHVDITTKSNMNFLSYLGVEFNILEQMLTTIVIAGALGYLVYRKLMKPKAKLTTTSTSTELEGVDSSISAALSTPGVSPQPQFTFDNTTAPFESRFEGDFEVIRELGEGGFGKVFEAKHKISEHNYAIKVIKLPSREDQRRKVEREVAALAKLEHPHILRYYSSWKECPTVDWTRARKYTTNSESVDSCTGAETTSNILRKPSTSGIYSGGTSSNNQSTFLPRDHQASTASDSIVFRDHTSAPSFSASNDRRKISELSDSIEFRENSNSRYFEKQSRSAAFDDRSDSIVFQNSSSHQRKSDMVLPIQRKSLDSQTDLRRNISSLRSRSVTFSNFDDTPPTNNTTGGDQEDKVVRHSYLYIQMQLCRDNTLKEWLTTEKDRPNVIPIFSQIVDAVEYIHSKNHIHRDLKPSNILFDDEGQVKVADFGLAIAMSNMASANGNAAGAVTPEYSVPSLTHNLGTKLYMSPELESNSFYDYKVDIFALGIILFELLVFFETGMERVELIQELRTKHKLPELIDKTYPRYKLILLQMIATEPEDRPTAAEVKRLITDAEVVVVM